VYSLGLTDEMFELATRRIVDTVITAPTRFDVTALELSWAKADFIYIDMHGRLDQPKWLFAGSKRIIASEQIKNYAKGKVIFATICDLTGTAWFDALRDGNVLVYGNGKNYGSVGERATGAQLLALWFKRFLEHGMSPESALKCAKLRVALTSWRKADRDALSFYIAPQGAAKEKHNG